MNETEATPQPTPKTIKRGTKSRKKDGGKKRKFERTNTDGEGIPEEDGLQTKRIENEEKNPAPQEEGEPLVADEAVDRPSDYLNDSRIRSCFPLLTRVTKSLKGCFTCGGGAANYLDVLNAVILHPRSVPYLLERWHKR